MQDALGLLFEGAKGEHLFRSTLVQTLFYKYFLNLQPNLSSSLVTAINPPPRPISDGVQTFQTEEGPDGVEVPAEPVGVPVG